MKNNMRYLLILLVMSLTPYVALADYEDTRCKGQSSLLANKTSQNQKYIDINATVEKHFTRDAYQFIDPKGRILAEVDGEVWRNQAKTEKAGVITL